MDNQQHQQTNNTTQPSSQSSTQNNLRIARNARSRERERELLAAGNPEMLSVVSDRILRRRFTARNLRTSVNMLRARRARNENLNEEELAVLAMDDRRRQRRAEYDRNRYARRMLQQNPPEQDIDDTSNHQGDSQPVIANAPAPDNQILPVAETVHNGNQDEEVVVIDEQPNELIQHAVQPAVENVVDAPLPDSENNDIVFAPEEANAQPPNQAEEVQNINQPNVPPDVQQNNIARNSNVIEQANAVAALQQLHNQNNNNAEGEDEVDHEARILYYHGNEERRRQSRTQRNGRSRSGRLNSRQNRDSVFSLLIEDVSIRNSSQLPSSEHWDNFDNCPICWQTRQDLASERLVLVKLNCRHIFCRPCLVKHINTNSSRDGFDCPICRRGHTFRSGN